ncbi:glycosyltransferase [Streptomyces xiaopingdaonensis]|uniref:glycosyltransferase n=1 Tax=Streptomyces xiaopingdaonensis TaxID=1565415 RepID=UPI0002E920C8|nr:glycosyltransferase [Streptomyces xiaopingdaonensis]
MRDPAPKLSIVIPYKQRLANIETVFTSLAEQTLDSADFEVVVGAMEYDPAYVALAAGFTERLSLTSVLTAEPWNTSRARNLGIRYASGRVVVVVDADVALAPDALRTLWERYFQHGQKVCVLGQVMGYEEVVESDAASPDIQPYAHYRKLLDDLEGADRHRLDPRFSAAYAPAFARFPWAFARTGLMALPTSTLHQHDLWLDEGFTGWGAEDQEWALRISRTGTPLLPAGDVYGLHLPHRRDFSAQEDAARRTNRYYLAKWPHLELELAIAFGGWLEAHRLCPQAEAEVARVAAGRRPAVVRGFREGRPALAVGALVDGAGGLVDAEAEALFDSAAGLRVLPLVGLTLPFDDDEFESCHLLPLTEQLAEPFRGAVRREAERVCAGAPRRIPASSGHEPVSPVHSAHP